MKKKLLTAAIAAALAGGAGTAQAVYISEDGLGQALLFPYYTVNGDFDTYINITNTSDQTAMFKIRFREAHNSRDARDFNVILSPYDVWVATVTMGPDGETPRIETRDTTCTAPQLPLIEAATDGRRELRGVEFTNLDYITPGTEGREREDWDSAAGRSIARTQQGHFEVLLMGLSDGGNYADAAKHADGVPDDCKTIRDGFLEANLTSLKSEFTEMGNVLKGAATLLKAGEGKAIGYDPVVLANWSPSPIIVMPGDDQPNLSDTDTVVETVARGSASFASGYDAASALLQATGVINQFSVNPNANVATDWVVTFPTKNHYVDKTTGDADRPFVERFQAGDNGRSCVKAKFNYYDREEYSPETSDDLDFSPKPAGTPDNAICKETNVITFANSNVLAADGITYNVPLEDGVVNGWMSLDFQDAKGVMTDDGGVWQGLPVIGFAITTREDGVSASERLSYGNAWSHAYKRVIS